MRRFCVYSGADSAIRHARSIEEAIEDYSAHLRAQGFVGSYSIVEVNEHDERIGEVRFPPRIPGPQPGVHGAKR